MKRDAVLATGAPRLSAVFVPVLGALAALSCAAPVPPPKVVPDVPAAAHEPAVPARAVALADRDRILLEWVRIRSLIAHLAEAKERIAIDGDSRDWAPFPFVATTLQATPSSPRTNLRLAIAPGRDDVLFCLASDAPVESWIRQWSDVSVDIEVEGRPGEILRLSFGQDAVRANARAWNRTVVRSVDPPSGSVDVAFRNCIEGRVDLSPFRKRNGGPFAPGFLETGDSSWMRVNVNLRQPPPRGEVGPGVRSRWRSGPSAASYLLDPERFLPPWAQPVEGMESAARCPPFLSGRWFVTQAGNEWPTHEGVVAYDFSVTDERGMPTRGEEEDFRNEDSVAWGAEVLAPSDGRVEWVHADEPDHPPISIGDLLRKDTDVKPPRANVVMAKGPFRWTFVHFQKESIPLDVGSVVHRGDLVGRVGDTGISTGPHLHAEFRACAGDGSPRQLARRGSQRVDPDATVPLVLLNVVVGLNGVADDPWGVHLPTWEVRSGYQVAPQR